MDSEVKKNAPIKSAESNKNKCSSELITYRILFWIFTLASVAGFVFEGVLAILKRGGWENHSALVIGPFCIIYGIGAVVIYLVSVLLKDRCVLLQFAAFAIAGSLVEYIGSLFQELVFGSTSWDYSKRFMNINGRICLQMTLIWGAFGLFFVRFVFPFLIRILEKTTQPFWRVACIAMSVFMAVDIMLSAAAVIRWENRTRNDSPASNNVQRILDRVYNDQTMETIYQNMRFSK